MGPPRQLVADNLFMFSTVSVTSTSVEGVYLCVGSTSSTATNIFGFSAKDCETVDFGIVVFPGTDGMFGCFC